MLDVENMGDPQRTRLIKRRRMELCLDWLERMNEAVKSEHWPKLCRPLLDQMDGLQAQWNREDAERWDAHLEQEREIERIKEDE